MMTNGRSLAVRLVWGLAAGLLLAVCAAALVIWCQAAAGPPAAVLPGVSIGVTISPAAHDIPTVRLTGSAGIGPAPAELPVPAEETAPAAVPEAPQTVVAQPVTPPPAPAPAVPAPAPVPVVPLPVAPVPAPAVPVPQLPAVEPFDDKGGLRDSGGGDARDGFEDSGGFDD
jgi:hypothetical protein